MIDVRDLCFHYQGSKHQVFSHFALQLNPGRVYGLLGKNGTGKSTLLYLISGLLRPDSGTVTVNGMESRLRLPEMLQEVFIVPEEYAMPDMSFEAFADMMRAFYPHFSDDLLAKCLADFEMPARPNLKELSMGQKRKRSSARWWPTTWRMTVRSSSPPIRYTTSRVCSTTWSSSTRVAYCSTVPSQTSLVATPSATSRRRKWMTTCSTPSRACRATP